MDQINKETRDEASSGIRKQTSMATLIIWNITKAIEANPSIDLKSAIMATEERLNNDMGNALAAQNPEEQYLACALLAWQQLGNTEPDTLYQFVETKRKEFSDRKSCVEKTSQAQRPERSPGSFISYNSTSIKGVGSGSYDSSSMAGPVVRLPVETKTVMRVDNTPARQCCKKKPSDKDLKKKIDAACCMKSPCMEKLNKLGTATTELRLRAERLARREAERVELLERAEAAWKELERGYQRRLALAEEKEDDMNKHITKLIEERNGYKQACETLAEQLRERGEVAEKERAKLTEIEKELCHNACARMRVREEAAKLDAVLSEQQCKGAQMDRDLQFKEEQIRRKLQAMESELDSERTLTCEVERALHAELSALRAQVTKVSHQLLDEDAENSQIKAELDLLRQEKLEMVEDLDGCKELCGGRVQGLMDDLKKKREQLNELKEKVMECQCKLPVDASVEVKRTPSLAALCKCTRDDKFSASCSCTSLRTTLLTNLLEDLFSGLQTELGGCPSEMPCQLLKCLEDKHDWDKSSVVTSNVRNYFSKLLICELDIAIATSIEKYHAKWVGASCADPVRRLSDRCGADSDIQERALEQRAQKLACRLAQQLFQERAEQLTAKAKEMVMAGPPPCECKPRTEAAAVYPCLVKPPTISGRGGIPATNSDTTPAYWRRTQHDVVRLRFQLEDLKKDSIKKEDLKTMEENIVKLVQRATDTENMVIEPTKQANMKKEVSRKENSIQRSVNTEQAFKHCTSNKLSSIKKKQSDLSPKKNRKNFLLGLQTEKPVKSHKNIGRSYAVNLCLCGSQKDKKSKKQDLDISQAVESNKQLKEVATRDMIEQNISMKQIKAVDSHIASLDTDINIINNNYSPHLPCKSNRICFHQPPSNTSIDKLLETLAKWKCDLSNIDSKFNILRRNTRDACPNTDIVEGEYKDIMPDIRKEAKEGDKRMFKNVSTKFSTNESVPFVSRIIVANMSKSTEYPSELPANTESVYMGAINLDKSNENMCKCVSDVRNEQEQSNEPKPTVFKCIDTNTCPCRKPDLKKNNTFTSKSGFGMNKTKENVWGNIQKGENSIQTESKLEYDINHMVKTSKLFPSDCEYCIKFLGVTLNASSNKLLAEKDEEPKHDNVTNKGNKRRNNHPEVWYNNVDVSSRSNPCAKLPAYDCSMHSNTNGKIDNVVTKQHGDFCKNEDKSINTQSFKDIPDKESCICCKTGKPDESKDLEVNAFHLLEEHLREKLEEFKLTNCKSYCIPPAEEEKMFSTILKKVKKIITDNTGVISCRCDPKEPAVGSWNRAYTLLQEYLKIKIKRVRCLCLSTNDEKDTLLPNVMEKVYNLIDNDFQRLKEICKCQNQSEARKLNTNIEIPVKDDCHTQDDETNTSNILQNPDKMSKEISNRSLIITDNISSQISPNIQTETTSCNIIEMSNNFSSGHTDECCRLTTINYDHCYCTKCTRTTKSYTDFGTKDVFELQEGKEACFSANTLKVEDSNLSAQHKSNRPPFPDLENQTDNRASIPYIGYTVDCSCESALGICTCTKSMISGNNDNINSIWNTLTSNKLRHNDTSYIMDAVPNKDSKEPNILKKTCNITELNWLTVKNTCDTVSSAHDCDELVLKDSNTKMYKTFLSTTTPCEDVCYVPDLTENINKLCDDDTCDDSLYHPARDLINRGTNEAVQKSAPIGSLSSSCECNVVPMCHVKMLVEDIENKLMHSKCTCDSLCSKICPVHSKKL